nr:DNA-directed RNA polymerases I and III subunit RPAC2 isoform X1 [Danio rerio]|eukprot:XP_005157198.1 DNA-directed RNA polymerases I and III subunit RPAC2 isoform X1 [Danio rerio]
MAELGQKHALEMVRTDGADEGCVTFVLNEEDHTLGNSLRYMIMKRTWNSVDTASHTHQKAKSTSGYRREMEFQHLNLCAMG